jgi:hypothetical protein
VLGYGIHGLQELEVNKTRITEVIFLFFFSHYLRTYNPEKNTSGRRADESITVKRLLKMCADVADGMFFLNEELKCLNFFCC